MTHEELMQKAKDAITAVFSDTSVSQEQTLDSLGELVEDAQGMIDAIESDLQKQIDDEEQHEAEKYDG